VVKLLLVDERINVHDAVDNETTFFVACEKGHLEVVKILLIDNRIDFNQTNICGIDALWISASNGHLDIVEYLLNSGKKLNLTSKWEVNISNNQENHKTVIEQVKYQISPEKIKFSWETDEILQKISENGPLILKLLEQYIQKENSQELIEKDLEEDKELIEASKHQINIEKEKEEKEEERVELSKLDDLQIRIESGEKIEGKIEKEQTEVDKSDNQNNVQHNIEQEERKKEKEKGEIQENVSKSKQDIQKDEQIILTGEFLKLGKGMLKQWQSRIFDLRLQSLAWRKYQNVNFFFLTI